MEGTVPTTFDLTPDLVEWLRDEAARRSKLHNRRYTQRELVIEALEKLRKEGK